MASGGGTVVEAQGATISGAIGGWGSPDTIDLQGVQASSFTFTAGTLTLYGANHAVVGDFAFTGTLSQADFAIGSDGHGGTDITDPNAGAASRSLMHGDFGFDHPGESVANWGIFLVHHGL